MGFTITNYAEYLSKHPPEYEVKIDFGHNGAGTSWSCAHGVERWRSDCGCHTGGPEGWNQSWRAPLRVALDELRDKIAIIFEQEGSKYLNDVWRARDDYIRLILDRSESNINDYFDKHQKEKLSPQERVSVIKLLEAQRYAMFMYTSCGWFFSEVSGIETVQIMAYAARGIELAQEFTNEDLEGSFLGRLSKVSSNMDVYGNAAKVYKKLVIPAKINFAQLASHYAISSIFEDYKQVEQLYCYKVKRLDYRCQSFGELTMAMGHINIISDITGECFATYFALLRFGLYDFRCSIKPFTQHSEYIRIKNKLFDNLDKLHVLDLIDLLEEHFGRQYLSLRNILLEQKRKILRLLSHDVIKRFGYIYQEFYDKNRRMAKVFKEVQLALPSEYLTAAEYTLSRQLNNNFSKLKRPLTMEQFERILDISNRARELSIKLKHEPANKILSEFLFEALAELDKKIHLNTLVEINLLLDMANAIKIDMDRRVAQDMFFQLLKDHRQFLLDEKKRSGGSLVSDKLLAVGSALGFNMQAYLE